MLRPDEIYISTAEAAQVLGISRQRVLQLIKDERLKAQRFANVYMIRRVDLSAVEERPLGRPPKSGHRNGAGKGSKK
jgi:excisionase family DNA binding protein